MSWAAFLTEGARAFKKPCPEADDTFVHTVNTGAGKSYVFVSF